MNRRRKAYLVSYTSTWNTPFCAHAEACRFIVEAWRGEKALELNGANIFMVTIDISSRDAI